MVVVAKTIVQIGNASCDPALRRPVIDTAAIAAITGYQRFLSPYKGFRCAYRVLHGQESCSAYVKRMVSEVGCGDALRLAHVRFRECSAAYHVLMARKKSAGQEGQVDRSASTSTGGVHERGCDGDSGLCDAACCTLDFLSYLPVDLGCASLDTGCCGSAVLPCSILP